MNDRSVTSGARAWRYLPSIVAAAAFLWFAGFLGPVARGEVAEVVFPWVPALGVELAFRIDGLALAFALLICGIGAGVLLYAAEYFRGDRRLGSLLVMLVAFAISMLGLVTADDAITLFVFWEGTTLTSWLLVGFDHEKASARAAALQALLVTAIGGLALLPGLLMMGGLAGSWRISEINAMGPELRASAAYPAVLALVLLGAFTKSAQFPFHFWLPNAMAAPTPVSAYLHSATMVKAGIYLLARLMPALGGTGLWVWSLTLAGAVTMLIGAVWALRQTDLKQMLAQTTVMALGLMTMLLAASTPVAVAAAVTFLLVHAFYKAALFLAVGMIEKGAGTREYPALGGLKRAMPLSFVVAGLAGLSMAGVPPLFGFIGKEAIYGAVPVAPVLPVLVTGAAVVANALMVACAGAVAVRPFLIGERRSPKAEPSDPGWQFWLGPAVLAGLGLVFGLLPGLVERALVGPMVQAISGSGMPGHLALWHGLGPALGLSLMTLGLGLGLYRGLDGLRAALTAAEARVPRTEGWYTAGLAGTIRGAGWLTARVQDGRMTSYLRWTFLTLAGLVWFAIAAGGAAWPDLVPRAELVGWAIFVVIVAAVVAVLRTPSRLAAIAALGGIGTGVALVFVLYGAIDVAMTQLFVEILVVVFLAIAMVRLPASGALRFRPGNAAVAVALGVAVTLVQLAVLGSDLDRFMTGFFEVTSAPEAHGRNIVNVILVDFRGFDTLGEIAVIVIAGVAAIAALRAGRGVAR